MDVIVDCYGDMINWVPKQDLTYKNHTRVIAGTNSTFVDHEDLSVWTKYFPNLNLQDDFHWIEAGHWVHFEKPKEFIHSLRGFVSQKSG